jgi:hypothetical protein
MEKFLFRLCVRILVGNADFIFSWAENIEKTFLKISRHYVITSQRPLNFFRHPLIFIPYKA